jgi:hypothetical protein
MFHAWMGENNGDTCLHCGVHVDYPWPADKPWKREMNSWSPTGNTPLPHHCPGPDVERAHYFTDSSKHSITCAFCDFEYTAEMPFDSFFWDCSGGE